jgi:hypothetical protein
MNRTSGIKFLSNYFGKPTPIEGTDVAIVVDGLCTIVEEAVFDILLREGRLDFDTLERLINIFVQKKMKTHT